MKELIPHIIGVIGTSITALFSYRLGKRKADANAKKDELSNIEQSIKIWRETAEAMAKEAKDTRSMYESIYLQNIELLSQNKTLISKVIRLEKEIEQLKKSV